MRELGFASDNEVVLEFLRGEIDSSRWGWYFPPVLRALRLDRSSLIDAADLSDDYANCARKAILGAARGYGRGDRLFRGFPQDTLWRRVIVEPSDFHRLKCISKDEQWHKLTGGTRLIQDAARNLDADSEIGSRVRSTIQSLEQGSITSAPLVLVEATESALLVIEGHAVLVEATESALVVLEGHTRATAYAVLSLQSFVAFVGTSPLMGQWSRI